MAIFHIFHVLLGLLLLKNVLSGEIATRKFVSINSKTTKDSIFPQNMNATTRSDTSRTTRLGTTPGSTPGTTRSEIFETRDADDLARERRDNATINQLIG